MVDRNDDKPHVDFENLSDGLAANAGKAANFLKALSHQGRFMIMCYLASGEKSVMELENLLDIRQAAVSQQLARLRIEGLVIPRREGKVIYYRLADDHGRRFVRLVNQMFNKDDTTEH